MKIIKGLAIAICLTVQMAKSVGAVTLSDIAFRVRVIEEDGGPITNAEVSADFPQLDTNPRVSATIHVNTLTDTNGLCAIVGKCNQQVYWGVSKTGYYRYTNMRLEGTNTIFNRVEPWNKLYTAQLRKIINPVPFVGRFVGLRSKVSIPRLAQPIGFDLLESDWVAPFGKGKNADLIIQLESELAKMPAGYYELHPRAGKYWNTKFAVTFANVKDGICEFVSPPNVGSIFRSPRFAPEDGFATNFTMVGDASTYNPPKLDQNFIFRIRSQLDDKGNVTNALHGKIYGPFEYTPSGGLKFQYLLNPKSNDRNLEFNPDKNCLQNLPRGEEIRDF